MSAELLRQAATILRERAEAVEDRDDWRDFYEGELNPTAGRDDGNWMALMSPGVGLALAARLELTAAGIDAQVEVMGATLDVVLARLIVGGAR